MAKRLTNPDKWDDDWYLEMAPKFKLAWEYLCDTCDGGTGFKKISFKKMSEAIGGQITREEFSHHFAERIHWVKQDVVWIHGYLNEQFKQLSPKNKAHVNMAKKVVREIGDQSLASKSLKVFEKLKDLIRASIEGELTLEGGSDEGQESLIGNRKKEIGDRKQEKIEEGGVGVFESQAEQQRAFQKLCTEAGLKCEIEYSVKASPKSCRFDAVILQDGKLAAIFEFKRYVGTEPRTDTVQLERYASFGVPVFLVKRDHGLNDVIEELIEFFKTGAHGKYLVKAPQTPGGSLPSVGDQISECWGEWERTLRWAGQTRKRNTDSERAIAKAIIRWGFEDVKLALLGARNEPSRDGYNPKKYVALFRIFEKVKGEPCKFEQFVGWGSELRAKEMNKREAEERRELPPVESGSHTQEFTSEYVGGVIDNILANKHATEVERALR